MDEEKKVSEILPPTEILAQMSEEYSEGAQAALKLRRALDGTNPTPKTIEECWENLKEEFGGCPEQHLCPAGRACERLCHAGVLRRMLEEGTGKIPTLEETSCGAQECCRTGLACLPELRQADGYVPAAGDSGRGEVSALLLPCLLQPELQSEDAGA